MNVLIDSSVWVDFFRGRAPARARVDRLLADGTAAIAGPIYAEVLSGAKSTNDYSRLSALLRQLEWLEPPDDCWSRIAQTRFTLARQGVEAHLVDLFIAHTAHDTQSELLTADKDFVRIARVLPLTLTVL